MCLSMPLFVRALFLLRLAPKRIRQVNALEAFLSADRSDRPEMTLDEINEEIRKARQERKERLAKEGKI